MKVKYISTIQEKSPMLFPFPGIEETDNSNEATCFFFDLHSRKYEYDARELQEVIDNENKPVCVFDFYDYGIYNNEESEWLGENDWTPLKRNNSQWATFLKFIVYQNRKVIWFVRKMDKTKDYGGVAVYPIELIMYPTHVFPKVTADELFDRIIDVCFIGNRSPTRDKLIQGLKDYGINGYYKFTTEGRYEHENWLHQHRQAKLFISCDGSGFNDERVYQLIYIAPMIKVKSNHLVLNDFTQGFSCLKVSETPLQSEIDFLKMILPNKERLHKIYLEGIKNMEKYYNPNYRSAYIKNVLYMNNIM